MLFSRKYVKLGIEVKSGILKVNVVSEEGALDFNIHQLMELMMKLLKILWISVKNMNDRLKWRWSQVRVKTVDIHSMTVMQAKSFLLQTFNKLEPGIEEVIVIHGFNQGTSLKELVLHEFKHPKIQSKYPSLNSGRTRIFIKS